MVEIDRESRTDGRDGATLPLSSSLLARMLLVAFLVGSSSGCPTQAVESTPDASLNASTDATVQGADATDDPGQAACPNTILVHDYSGGIASIPWGVGAPGTCAAPGFELDTIGRTATEAACGEPCGMRLCVLVAPKNDPLTAQELARACALEAQLGPLFWVCAYERVGSELGFGRSDDGTRFEDDHA